jgi:predicted ester cyclase
LPNDAVTRAAEPKELVRSYHERVWTLRDLTALADSWSSDAYLDVQGFDGHAIEVLRADIDRYFIAFTDVKSTIVDLVGEDDRVVLHWETAGLHVGPYGAIAPTGKVITMRGIDILRVEAGLIVACTSMWDGLSVYEQLGLLPDDLL